MEKISRHYIKTVELIAEEIDSTNEELEEDFYYLQQNPENLSYFSKTMLETASSARVRASQTLLTKGV